MLRYLSAGESHGKALIGVLEGLPAGLSVDIDFVNTQLRRRQSGYGRGPRMRMENDRIEIVSGVRHGKTLGSPISFVIPNRDWRNWRIPMSPEPVPEDSDIRRTTRPRPGHGDLAGALKFQTHDARDILERASARETAVRVAVGSFCRMFLLCFNLRIGSCVLAVGGERVRPEFENLPGEKIFSIDSSPLACPDPEAETRMIALIDRTRKAGDTLGGILEVAADPVPPGLGSHIQWDRKLDGRLAQALMSIPAVKAVEIGAGAAAASMPGSAVHDEIFYDRGKRRFFRKTNRAGGLEAGITNGAEIRARAYVKPIPTLRKPLQSVDLATGEPYRAAFERSDVCVVPAAAVIAEAVTAIVLAEAFLEKFGGDSMAEIEANFANYQKLLDEFVPRS